MINFQTDTCLNEGLIERGVDHVLPSDDQYSFLHVKAFGLHNHLSADPWSTEYIYFIDKKFDHNVVSAMSIHPDMIEPGVGTIRLIDLSLIKHCVSVKLLQPSRVEELREVWEMPSHHERRPGHYNPSMSFSSPELVLLSDGAGTLHLVNTGPRDGTAPWESFSTLFIDVNDTRYTMATPEGLLMYLVPSLGLGHSLQGSNSPWKTWDLVCPVYFTLRCSCFVCYLISSSEIVALTGLDLFRRNGKQCRPL
uniref:Uncharacterized protein n=1 Tax=Timema shepardi TaxID=629360 RepID=A0A7R9B882_TIMSH|nr:unnamed protein product [Timema shepardi]